jgi:hypothetical protein
MNGVAIEWKEEIYEIWKAELSNGWSAMVLRRVGTRTYVIRAQRGAELPRDGDWTYGSLEAAQTAALELAEAGRE